MKEFLKKPAGEEFDSEESENEDGEEPKKKSLFRSTNRKNNDSDDSD